MKEPDNQLHKIIPNTYGQIALIDHGVGLASKTIVFTCRITVTGCAPTV